MHETQQIIVNTYSQKLTFKNVVQNIFKKFLIFLNNHNYSNIYIYIYIYIYIFSINRFLKIFLSSNSILINLVIA